MKLRTIFYLTATTISLMFITSCTTTRLTSVWKDNSYTQPLKRVIVVGVSDNPGNRRLLEEAFASQLAANGVEAFSSAAAIPSNRQPDKETIAVEAKKLGADAVLVTHLVGVEEETVYYPGTSYLEPYGYYDHLGRYYSTIYAYVHEPGYYSTYSYVKMETNLYQAATENLIWAITSETVESRTVNKMVESLARAVIKNLRQNGLIQPPQ